MTASAQPKLTEAEFMAQVIDLATLLGWECAHFRPALTQRGWRTPVQGSLGKGFPDLVLVRERDRRLIFAELKRDGAKLSSDQNHVLTVLARVQEAEGDCTCDLVQHVDFAHREDCAYTLIRRGVEVHVWRPSSFATIAEILR